MDGGSIMESGDLGEARLYQLIVSDDPSGGPPGQPSPATPAPRCPLADVGTLSLQLLFSPTLAQNSNYLQPKVGGGEKPDPPSKTLEKLISEQN